MPENTANNKRIAKNTLFLTLRMLFVLVVYIYTSRVLLNTLGVEDYGVYNVIAGFVSMFAFLNTSLANGIQRFYNYELGSKGNSAVTEVYNAAIRIQVVLAIVVLLLLETVGLWYLYTKMVLPPERMGIAFWLFQFSVISSLLTIMQIPFLAAIMSYEKMDFYALVGIIDVLANLGIAASLPFLPFDKLFIYGLLILLRFVLMFLMYFIYSKKHFPALKLQRKVSGTLVKDMLGFSGWNVFGTFGGMIRDQGMNMVLNLFFGPVVNAARGVANQVSGAVNGFVSNVGVAVRPQLTGSYACGDKERAFHLMYSITKISFISLYMFAVPIMFEVDYILDIWLGEAIPEHTAAFVVIGFVMALVGSVNPSFSAIIHSSGKMKWYQITGAICNISVLPFAYIALKQGCTPEFALWVSVAFVFLNQVVALFVLRYQEGLSIRDYLRKVVAPMLLAAAVSIVFPYLPYKFMPEGFLRLVVTTVASIIAVSFAFYFLAIDNSEKEMINNALKNLKSKYFKKS